MLQPLRHPLQLLSALLEAKQAKQLLSAVLQAFQRRQLLLQRSHHQLLLLLEVLQVLMGQIPGLTSIQFEHLHMPRRLEEILCGAHTSASSA